MIYRKIWKSKQADDWAKRQSDIRNAYDLLPKSYEHIKEMISGLQDLVDVRAVADEPLAKIKAMEAYEVEFLKALDQAGVNYAKGLDGLELLSTGQYRYFLTKAQGDGGRIDRTGDGNLVNEILREDTVSAQGTAGELAKAQQVGDSEPLISQQAGLEAMTD